MKRPRPASRRPLAAALSSLLLSTGLLVPAAQAADPAPPKSGDVATPAGGGKPANPCGPSNPCGPAGRKKKKGHGGDNPCAPANPCAPKKP